MDFPSSFIGESVAEGEVYHFSDKSPIGIPNHEHVCIKRYNKVLLFSTCSSQTDTALRLAKVRNWNMNTFPMFVSDEYNHFRETTYVNCNECCEVTEEQFGDLCKAGIISRAYGDSQINPNLMHLIVTGIRLSTEIPDEIKDLFVDVVP